MHFPCSATCCVLLVIESLQLYICFLCIMLYLVASCHYIDHEYNIYIYILYARP